VKVPLGFITCTGLAFYLNTILLSPDCRWGQVRSFPASSYQNKMLAL